MIIILKSFYPVLPFPHKQAPKYGNSHRVRTRLVTSGYVRASGPTELTQRSSGAGITESTSFTEPSTGDLMRTQCEQIEGIHDLSRITGGVGTAQSTPPGRKEKV